jgi:AcrR family transcriptional regulator
MGRREQNKADKRERLEVAGLQAFLEEGYATASVERIAAAAGVARGTFYLYFRDKEALFVALVERLFTPLGDALRDARAALAACPDAASTFPVYGALGLSLAGLLAERADEVRIYFAESRSPGAAGEALRARAATIEAETEDILRDAVARGVLRPHDTHAVALAIFGGIERLVGAWLVGDTRLDALSLPAEVTLLFRYGLAPPG